MGDSKPKKRDHASVFQIPEVIEVVVGYENGQFTLNKAAEEIKNRTGTAVSRSTIWKHVQRLTETKKHQKQQGVILQNAPENPTESIISTSFRRKCERSGIGQADDADLVTFTLSSKLERTVINIREGSIIRQYRANNLKKEGRISYYVCQTCDLLKRKGANIIVPKIRIRYNRIVGDAHPPHAEQCLGISEEKMLAIAEDREARLRVREGLQLPRSAFNEGFERTVRSAANSQELSNRVFSVSTKYPLWKNVRRSYYRAKKHAKTRKRNETVEQSDGNIAKSTAVPFEEETYEYPNEHNAKAETSGVDHESQMAHDYHITLRQRSRGSVNKHFGGDYRHHEVFVNQLDMPRRLVDSSCESFNSNNCNQSTDDLDKCIDQNFTRIDDEIEANNSRIKMDQYESGNDEDELINVVTIEHEQSSNILSNESATLPSSSNMIADHNLSSDLSLCQQHQSSPTANLIIQSSSSASYSFPLDAVKMQSSNPPPMPTYDPLICHITQQPRIGVARNEMNNSLRSQPINQESLISQNDNVLIECKSQTNGDNEHDSWEPLEGRVKMSDEGIVGCSNAAFNHPNPKASASHSDDAVQRYDWKGQVVAGMTVKEFLIANKNWNKLVDKTSDNPLIIEQNSTQSICTNQRVTNETNDSSYADDRLNGIGELVVGSLRRVFEEDPNVGEQFESELFAMINKFDKKASRK